MPGRRTRRSTTTSIVWFSYRASRSCVRSVSSTTSPSIRARVKPWPASSSSRPSYSPLRPRTTGARTWKRVPSGSSSTRSTICCGRLAGDDPAAVRAVRDADPRVEQAQVVVDLGDRADGRARVAARRLLVDGDRGRQALDEVDVGLVHLAQELARVAAQALDVAALALRVDRVERQAALAAAGQTGDHDEPVARQVDVDVAQVVFARAADRDQVRLAGRDRLRCPGRDGGAGHGLSQPSPASTSSRRPASAFARSRVVAALWRWPSLGAPS